MAKYVDICIQPIPKKHVADYRKSTRFIGKLLLKHGALASRDYVAEDDNATRSSFPKKIKLNKGEVLIFAVTEFKSKAHREKVFQKLQKDPAMKKFDGMNFMDPKRMVMGGFAGLVDME